MEVYSSPFWFLTLFLCSSPRPPPPTPFLGPESRRGVSLVVALQRMAEWSRCVRQLRFLVCEIEIRSLLAHRAGEKPK